MVLRKFLTTETILVAVWVFAIIFRCQNFFMLPIDAHPMRQTDTESVAYYFATVDANPLHPQASLIRPQTNIHGYFFLEVPFYPYILSLFYRLFGTSVVVARVMNLALFTISYWLIFMMVAKHFSKQLALWSTIVYSLIPSSIFFFGHAIHPDLFAIATVLGSGLLLSQTKRRVLATVSAGLLFATAVGSRPFILMALPSLLTLVYFKKGKWWQYVILTLSSVSIYGLWSWWQSFFPEADHSWQYWTLQGREVLYTYEGWKFLIWRNVSGEVVGRVASGLAVIGLAVLALKFFRSLTRNQIPLKLHKLIVNLIKNTHSYSVDFKLLVFCLPWLAAVPVYWLVVPAGNTAHQYYANVFVLPIIFLAGYGALTLIALSSKLHVKLVTGTLIVLALTWNGLRTSSYFYNNLILPEHTKIAGEIEKAIPQGEKIVYMANNNSVPFSLAHRQGWMFGGPPTDVDNTAHGVLNMKQYGAQYAVWAKNNNDISEAELKTLEEHTVKVYESETIKVFKL